MVPGDSGRARKGLNSQPNCIPKLHSSRARLDGKAPQVLRCQIRSSSRRTPVDPAFFHLGSAQGQAGSTRSQCRKGGAVESDGELWLQGGQSSSSSGLAFQLRLCVCCRFPPLLMNPRASWSDLQDLGSSLQKRQSATTESMAFHSGSCLAFFFCPVYGRVRNVSCHYQEHGQSTRMRLCPAVDGQLPLTNECCPNGLAEAWPGGPGRSIGVQKLG